MGLPVTAVAAVGSKVVTPLRDIWRGDRAHHPGHHHYIWLCPLPPGPRVRLVAVHALFPPMVKHSISSATQYIWAEDASRMPI